MKKLTFSFIIALLISGFAFSQNCITPMPNNVYKQHLSQLALKPNDQAKLQYSKNMLQGSCLLSAQIKDLAIVFGGDYYRYEFCKRAWRHTFDRENFYDVYDAFVHLSSAIRLYDFISSQKENNSNNIPATNPSNTTMWYANITYPTAAGYKGITGCELPIADNDFDVMARTVVVQKTDALRRIEAIRFSNNNCISMSQAMKLGMLFELESNRIAFMKEIFTGIYDMENYGFASEIYSHLPYKNEWQNFCAAILTPPVIDPAPPVALCEISNQEYEDARKSISNVSVNSTKLTLAKQVIKNKRCFSVQQIAGIIRLFSVESSRLEVALYSYEYCLNTADYYELTEELYTTSSKNKLLELLNSKN